MIRNLHFHSGGLQRVPSIDGRLASQIRYSPFICRAAWVENSAKKQISAPVESCYPLWLDRELIPSWMPWIASVKVLEEDPALSCWILKTNQFERDWEFTWIARNLEPIPYRKVHWKSETPPESFQSAGTAVDLNNRGQVRFVHSDDESCLVTLSIEYEVPEILVPFAQLLTPLVEAVLLDNLTRFDKYAIAAYKQQSKLK
eukprot:g5458.t1